MRLPTSSSVASMVAMGALTACWKSTPAVAASRGIPELENSMAMVPTDVSPAASRFLTGLSLMNSAFFGGCGSPGAGGDSFLECATVQHVSIHDMVGRLTPSDGQDSRKGTFTHHAETLVRPR